MNTAYKHLEAKLRVGELTIVQWIGLFVGGVTALLWGLYVSPFGTTVTLFSTIYIGGLPAGAIILATMSEVDVLLIVRSAIRWHREEGRHLAGPGPATSGYVVRTDRRDNGAQPGTARLADLDLEALWEA